MDRVSEIGEQKLAQKMSGVGSGNSSTRLYMCENDTRASLLLDNQVFGKINTRRTRLFPTDLYPFA
jgi:hypothetical protein